MSTVVSIERRIKFLSRDLPFPVDPTFREYRVIQDITGVTAQEIMTGTAGIWMLPALAIVALTRADKNVSRAVLDKLLDLDPSEITLVGNFNNEDDDDGDVENPPVAESPQNLESKSTGTLSTPESLEASGTPDLLTTSQAPQESPTT